MTITDLPPADANAGANVRDEVLQGLGKSPKEIHPKFFYDQRGSELFARICELDEYYLTRTELEIMRWNAIEMAALIGAGAMLIEYGSGASLKTQILLDALRRPVAYVPIDISRATLEASAIRLVKRYDELEVLPINADYLQPVELPVTRRFPERRVVYFPGSTIGNFVPRDAESFVRRIARQAGPGGALLIGVDLDKDPDVLHRAYNDSAGVTAAFNLNLLVRFNRELGADFDLEGFHHKALYNQQESRIEMYLVSERRQTVTLGDAEISFEAGEEILTEYSYKYSLASFRELADAAGFEVERVWTDEARLFSVQYLTAKGD